MREVLERVLDGGNLAEPEASAVMRALADPALAPAMAGAMLAALRAKGATADEVRGFARAMRSLARRPQIDAALQSRAIDIVGTGGDASGSVNISTGTSLLAAACGLPVIKHGNRSISSRSGSADVLERLGLTLPLDETQAGACLAACGFTFLFAPHYHPAMKAIAPVRQALGVRTIFNVLGPLTNPAEPPYQVVGAYSAAMAELMAGTLAGMPGYSLKPRADLPDPVAIVIGKAMARDPAHRYGSALELAEDLDRFLLGERVLARRPGVVARVAMFCTRRPLQIGRAHG